jgi:hypothetical protein
VLLTLGKKNRKKIRRPGISHGCLNSATLVQALMFVTFVTPTMSRTSDIYKTKKDFLFFHLISDDDITLLLLGRKIIIKEKKDLALPPGAVCV